MASRNMGLMKREEMLPETTAANIIAKTKMPTKKPKIKSKEFNHQEANIKTSLACKEELELLMRFTNLKFVYEVLETLIDYYVENALSTDEKRAFMTLKKFI